MSSQSFSGALKPVPPVIIYSIFETMRMCWNVDYLNISHRDEDMVTEFAVEMSNICRVKTAISRGRVNKYLGMELDFGTCPGTLIISMIKYLQKIIDEFSEFLRGTKACPAGDNLFNI